MRRIPLLVAATFLVAVGSVCAQGTSGFHFGLGGGITQPQGEAEDILDDGWNAGAVATFNFPAVPIGIRVDGWYHRLDNNTERTGERGGTDIIAGTANAVLGFRFLVVKPYVLGGVGYYRLDFSTRTIHEGSFFDQENETGWNAGAGVSISLRKIDLFVEARYHSVSTEGDRFEFVPVSLGLVF
jgi:opacity protein-like surface antigen